MDETRCHQFIHAVTCPPHPLPFVTVTTSIRYGQKRSPKARYSTLCLGQLPRLSRSHVVLLPSSDCFRAALSSYSYPVTVPPLCVCAPHPSSLPLFSRAVPLRRCGLQPFQCALKRLAFASGFLFLLCVRATVCVHVSAAARAVTGPRAIDAMALRRTLPPEMHAERSQWTTARRASAMRQGAPSLSGRLWVRSIAAAACAAVDARLVCCGTALPLVSRVFFRLLPSSHLFSAIVHFPDVTAVHCAQRLI